MQSSMSMEGGTMVFGPVEGVRERNRRLIYRCLLQRSGEPLSRHDLGLATGLSHPTVGTILQEFAELGLCKEVGHSYARGGRPAQLLNFNPEAVCVVGVDLSGEEAGAALLDLTGHVLERAEGPTIAPGADAQLLGWLGSVLDEWSAGRTIGRLAVALPGVVEPRSGTVHHAPALGWHNHPFAAALHDSFGYEVTLENDVNALAVAELRLGAITRQASALFLALTTGVGMSVAVNGRIHRGSRSAAGEIGYGAVGRVARTPKPSFAQRGELETHLQALMARVTRGDRLELASPDAREAFEELASDLAVVVQNAVCLLDPELLVVSWPADRDQALVSALGEKLSVPLPIEVIPAALGDDASLLGVAHLALDACEDQFTTLTLPARIQLQRTPEPTPLY